MTWKNVSSVFFTKVWQFEPGNPKKACGHHRKLAGGLVNHGGNL